MTTETETSPSPVVLLRPRAATVEAVQWDRTPGVLAVLKEWGAEPAELGDALRVWGSRDGYAGAAEGDWLVRDPRRQGAARYAPEQFEALFEIPSGDGIEPSGGERNAWELLLRRAQEALAFERERADQAEGALEAVRRLARSWQAAGGTESTVVGSCAAAVLGAAVVTGAR